MELRIAVSKARSIVSGVFLIAGLALSISLLGEIAGLAASTPLAGGTPAALTGSAASDFLIPPTDEGRAQFGNIFVAAVIGHAGEHQIPTSSPDDEYRVPLFDVSVEQTLKGDATGQVRIMYDDPGDLGPEAQRLRVGGRYLFFAGYMPDKKWYPVDPLVGAIPIKSDRQAADLVATFEPLIRAAERGVAEAGQPDPCETPRQAPSVNVEPAQGRPGDRVRLVGGPFLRPEAPVSWDGKGAKDYLLAAPVDADCTVDVELIIPEANAGEHRIFIYDAGANEAFATFEIVE